MMCNDAVCKKSNIQQWWWQAEETRCFISYPKFLVCHAEYAARHAVDYMIMIMFIDTWQPREPSVTNTISCSINYFVIWRGFDNCKIYITCVYTCASLGLTFAKIQFHLLREIDVTESPVIVTPCLCKLAEGCWPLTNCAAVRKIWQNAQCLTIRMSIVVFWNFPSTRCVHWLYK